MNSNFDVIIVGASVAGVTVLRELRRLKFNGSILLVDKETIWPYDKPPLSKDFLKFGDSHNVSLLEARELSELGASLLLGVVVVDLRVNAHELELDDGRILLYRTAVLAAGATPIKPSGLASTNSHVLRTYADCQALRKSFRPGNKVAVIGAGFIGCEVASVASAMGAEVQMVDIAPWPLAKVADFKFGEWLLRRMERNHIKAEMRTRVEGVSTVTPDRTRLALNDEQQVRVTEVTAVVIGVGAKPNVAWLRNTPLTCCPGVQCDSGGRAIHVRDVYAVGDVACWWDAASKCYEWRQHWTSAVSQGVVAASNIAGKPAVDDSVPYVWSDILGARIQIVGATGGDCIRAAEIERPDGETVRFAVVYARPEMPRRACGAICVNASRGALIARNKLRGAMKVDDLIEPLRASLCA